MKSILSLLIRFLRFCFYNTPVKNWKITAFIYGKVARLQIGGERFQVIPFQGVKLKVDANDGVLTAGLYNGHFERFTIQIFRELLQERAQSASGTSFVFLDIGANIGVFTTIAAASGTPWRIFSFEPNPNSYQLLQENIKLNNATGVETHNAAVGAEKGTASLDVSSESAALHSIHGAGSNRIEVPVIAMNDFCADRQIKPSLVKIDVEGYEPFVLKGMSNITKGTPLWMILEFNPETLKWGGKAPEEFIRELAETFEKVYVLDESDSTVVPYTPAEKDLERKLCTIGYNVVLVNGETPAALVSKLNPS
jgi:FkbM family methyltransferase